MEKEPPETLQRQLSKYPDLELQAMMMNCGVTDDPGEAIYVSYIVKRNISQKDIIPSIVEHNGLALAARCLISLGFFPGYMQHLTDNHGYPSPEFYMEAGKREFFDYGKKDVSGHMEIWVSKFNELFCMKIEKKDEIEVPVFYETVKFHKAYRDYRQWKAPGFLKRGYELGDLKDENESNGWSMN